MTRFYLIAFLLFFLIGLAFYLFRRAPKKKRLSFKDSWRAILNNKVRYYQRLPAAEKSRFEQEILDFFQDCDITGVDYKVTDTDRLLVASSAVIPIFGFKDWHRYPHLREVLLYPTTFNPDSYATKGKDRNVLGMVGWGYMNGQMILSAQALRNGFEQAGRSNVGIHEFVHLLDKMDGATDGLPEYILERQYTIPWLDLVYQEIEAIKKDRSDLRDYGGTSETEFFAVASEYFFQRPEQLQRKHPELFDMLEEIFQQDLA
ncbi:MAG: M90 family metallopeptidase [Bacteroidota bacterium]